MRRFLTPVLAVLAALAATSPAAAQVPAGYTYSHHWYESKQDGAQIHAGVFLPTDLQPEEKVPAIVTVTPYASPTEAGAPVNRFPELFGEDGIANKGRYAYVQVDARSFGGSEGCWEYYGVKEAQDSGQAVDEIASLPWSDGTVAMYGKSYDAATQVLAMGQKPEHLSAAIIQAPGLSGYTGLWYNGVHYATGRYATSPTYTADDMSPNADTTGDERYTAAFADGLTQSPQCRAEQVVLANVIGDRSDPFWSGREPYLLAKGSDVPVFWSHGFWDANTKPVHLDIWESLTGPKKAWFGQYTHLRGQEAGVGRREEFMGEVERFLDFYVRGEGKDPLKTDPVMTIQERNGEGAWREEKAWPPKDAEPWTMPLKTGKYVDKPGNGATTATAASGLWTFTKPLPHDAHLAGEGVVSIDVTTLVPDAKAVVHLYDYDPETGQAEFVQRGASFIKNRGDQTVTFNLYPQDHRFLAGHRIGLRLSASDDSWWTGGVSQTDVTVRKGSLTLPLLKHERVADLEGGPSNGMSNPFNLAATIVSAGEVEAEAPPRQTPAGGPPAER